MTGKHHFFAFVSRLKLIQRWGLMRCHVKENVAEHSLQVAQIAHCLALKKTQSGDHSVDPARCALLALYHDATEVLTGDLPTPIKYANADITDAYRHVEHTAREQLLAMLPSSLHGEYQALLGPGSDEAANMTVVKRADTVCALLKSREELAAGNREFSEAEKTLSARVSAYEDAEVNWFIEHFAPSFSLCLDDMRVPQPPRG